MKLTYFKSEQFEEYKKKHPWYQSQGFKKLWNYYLTLVERSDFQKEIVAIRKKVGIPIEGISFEEKSSVIVNKENTWDEAWKFALKYGFDAVMWQEPLEFLIIYGYVQEPNDVSLCVVHTLIEERIEPYSKPIMDSYDKIYPIFIRVSPYATKRDILDFVERTYKTNILRYQNEYKTEQFPIGKYKKKKQGIKERNDFIWEHRDLPRREIMGLLYDKYGKNFDIDHGYIGKIISIERKKRKEV